MSVKEEMRVLVIINGVLRIRDKQHLERCLKFLGGSDVIIASYNKNRSVGKIFSDECNVIGQEYFVDKPIEETEYHKKIRAESEKTASKNKENGLGPALCNPASVATPGQMNQWFLLDRAIKLYRDKNKENAYDFIVRYRTDLEFDRENLKLAIEECHKNADQNTLWCHTDFFFFSTEQHFLKLFSDMWQYCYDNFGKNDRYLDISWENLLSSDLECFRFPRFYFPRKLFPDRSSIQPANLKRVISENLSDLCNNRFDRDDCHAFWTNNGPIASEKYFALKGLEGIIKKTEIDHKLMKSRGSFNFNGEQG